MKKLAKLEAKHWTAAPTGGGKGEKLSDRTRHSTRRSWSARSPTPAKPTSTAWSAPASPRRSNGTSSAAMARAELLNRAADLFEQHREELFSLCIREAGKTVPDAVLEVREAVDFLRYYASEARRLCGNVTALPGPTGELNELRLHGRGVFACISPWNFPLAIFIGPVAAALAAGNAAIAKPAEQTPLIGARAIELMHAAGIPKAIVQLAPGDGKVGAALTGHPLIGGVAFTGSTDTARAINRSLADARRPDRPADRRNRRPECDDRRLLGAAGAGDPRRRRLGLPERRPALLGAARAVRPGRCRGFDAGDDCRRDAGADRRRSRRPRPPMSAR